MEKRLSTVIRRHCLVAHPPFFTEIKLSFNSEKYDSQCKYQSFINLTGFNIKDVLGKSAYLFVHGGDMEYVAKAHKEMVEKNIVIEIVFRSTTKSQGIYFTSSRTFVIRDNWTEKPKMIIAVNHVIRI
ncbi:single-minded homolog 2 isoform X3 [Octopus vulgaris]|uniref:Single-minded homolog 2 isoform X3 n=1 Tax=Octopus vulgaris TaxID=6645 RepID=A0AA36B0T4_OCTVU|nr:single-minded homolog 2 isoform X3 [Octopus vulgaris]